MSDRAQHRIVPEEDRASEHLANERTFLAWVRTNIALISLGFVLTRLSPLIREGSDTSAHRAAFAALPLGIGLAGFGALLTLLAAWRYDAVNREIEAGMVKTDRGLVWFVTVLITLLSVALIGYEVMG